MSEEVLQIAEKRREVKGKGQRERYTHMNAEFHRTVRRDNKVFLNEQCKDIEEKNRMGKSRDLFKKIGDTEGTFHTKMGTIKDRIGIDHNRFESVSFSFFPTSQTLLIWKLPLKKKKKKKETTSIRRYCSRS